MIPAVRQIVVLGGYTAEAKALFARMTTQPTADRKRLINNLIKALKAGGIWDKLDAFYVLAATDSQAALLNWKQALYDCTAVNSPTFTADRGYTGDGATSYLDTGFNPTTAPSAKFVQDNAHMAVWCGTDISSSLQVDIGSNNSRICARVTTTVNVRPNNGAVTPAISNSTSIGWTCWARANATDFDAVRNADAPVNTAAASTALGNLPFYILAIGAAGPVPANFSARRVQAAHFGSYLNDTERDAAYNALAAYMTAVGA